MDWKTLRAAIMVLLPGCCAFLPCDPGWGYKVAGATEVRDNGRRYVISGPGGTSVRIYGSLFTSNLHTEMELTNVADSPLAIAPDQLRVYDSRGGTIARMFPDRSQRCEGRPDRAEVQLLKGDTCKIRADYTVRPDPKVLGSIRIVHDGVTRDARQVPIVVLLEMAN